MQRSYRTTDLLKYINAPLNHSTISTLYEANNIDIEYCDLLCDYIISLNMKIFDTYLGDDIMTQKTQQEHFKWCWDKVRENFKDEGIIINDNNELYNYFLEFLNEAYYNAIDKDIRKRENSD